MTGHNIRTVSGRRCLRMISRTRPFARALILLLLLAACAAAVFVYLRARHRGGQRAPLAAVRTLAGAGGERFGETFGVAVAPDNTTYVTDGLNGRLYAVSADGTTRTIAENLNAPSGLAVAPDGTLIVADAGSHTIKRVEPRTGRVSVIAGAEGSAGFGDGSGPEALFNGPVGVAIGPDGTIYVADTYNDRVRAVSAGGQVRTVAGGGAPGDVDHTDGGAARFNTPCGVAIAPDGSLVVADTGNHKLRRVETGGATATLAGTGAAGNQDGPPSFATFGELIGVAFDSEGNLYVADAGRSASVRVVTFGLVPLVKTLGGGKGAGIADGALGNARFNQPSGVAAAPDNSLVVADSGNKLVRVVTAEDSPRGSEVNAEAAKGLRPSAAEMRGQAPPRWPYDPPDRPREIAATFGEIRGEIAEGEDAWFHNGLDIPGAYGETARFVRDETMLRPLAVDDVGGPRERVRFPALGYIHLRVGRDRSDRPFADDRFQVLRDEGGSVTAVRVRRGAHFRAGEFVGTLNDQNHVHLIAGPPGGEWNALAALVLPGVKDTVAPTVEGGVALLDREYRSFGGTGGGGRVAVRGDVRVVVRAYDRMDGNAERRRLGLYRLGYQVLAADGTPAENFAEPLVTISFDTLPDDSRTAHLAYAEGSRSGHTGPTVFAYLVTNFVRDRAAREAFWETAKLAPGDYTLRVFAEDFFGNRTTRDVPVRVLSQ